jgi:hypothetical protein
VPEEAGPAADARRFVISYLDRVWGEKDLGELATVEPGPIAEVPGS